MKNLIEEHNQQQKELVNYVAGKMTKLKHTLVTQGLDKEYNRLLALKRE